MGPGRKVDSSVEYTSPRFSLSVSIALLSLASGLYSYGQAAPQARSLATVRITQPVDASSMVTLKGNVSPLANARNDIGSLRPDTAIGRIQLVLKRGPQQESALRQLIQDMHTPGSPSYHKWLTPSEFGQQFGPSDQDIQTIENWVSSRGFQVEKLSPDRGMLEISGTSGQLDSTFHTAMHRYLLNGQQHYANSTDPQIPSALAPVVGGFVSLNNFPVHRLSRTLGRAAYNPQNGQATPEWTNPSTSALGYSLVVSPKDYAVQYDLNPLYSAGTNGSGQTIAIVNDANINLNLVNNFRSLFGLTPNPPHVIIDGNDPGIDGVNNVDGPNGDSIEAYLDVEWAGAVAPSATIDLVIGADTAVESGVILAAERAIYSNLAPVLSLSFGACEEVLGSSGNAFINGLWEQAAAQGITVLVASGDSGSAGTDPTGKYCDNPGEAAAQFGTGVSGYASTPYNVAVGGTDFYYSSYNSGTNAILGQVNSAWNTTPSTTPKASLNAPLPEQPWNDSAFGLNILISNNPNIAGAGGGPSTCGLANSISGACVPYPKPAWQTGTGVPNDSARDLPDVSLFAADGLNDSYVPICANDGDCQPGASTTQVTGVGGTSAAAPSMAGIMALVNQKYGPQGQADYTLYPLAKQYPAAFHDVTMGTNAMPCSLTSSNMAAGDCVTGGTVSGQGELKGYAAGAGYDAATGLGSIDANVLVSDWGNIHLTATSTTLTPSSTSFTHGTAVTFNTSVTGSGGTPSGSVALMTDSTSLSQQGSTTLALKSGSGTGSVNFLPGGTYNVWGAYSGDGTFAASASSKTQITVAAESSKLILTPAYPSSNCNGYCAISSGNIPYGTQIILDGVAVPSSQYQCTQQGNCTTSFAPATGTVAFSDNGNVINTAVINVEGDAEFTTGNYAIGNHSITASYSGDASYSQSTASAINFTVVKGTPTVSLTSNATNLANSSLPFYSGQTLVLTAYVDSGGNGTAPTGNLTFSNAVGSPVALVAGVDPNTGSTAGIATLVLPNWTASESITAVYAGDSNYGQASSSAMQVTVSGAPGGRAATTTTATLSPNTSTTSPSSGITLNVTVTGQGNLAPTGSIDIQISGIDYGNSAISPGSGDASTFSVVLNSGNLLQGTNQITLLYSGDSHYLPSSYTLTNPISNPRSDFSMVATNPVITVASGASASATVAVSSVNGFSGAVALSCAAPSAVTCSLDPSSATVSGSSPTSVKVSVTAASASSALRQPAGPGWWLASGGATFACIFMFGLPDRRRRWRSMLCLIAIAFVTAGIGCGGGSSSSGGGGSSSSGGSGSSGSNGNAAANGTYTVVVSGTSGSALSHNVAIEIKVQ